MEEHNMIQTISDLWNGEITHCKHCGAHDSQANQIARLMARNRELLHSGLTAAQAELFQKYIDCTEDYLLRMLELAFCEGFRIGGRLAIETSYDI